MATTAKGEVAVGTVPSRMDPGWVEQRATQPDHQALWVKEKRTASPTVPLVEVGALPVELAVPGGAREHWAGCNECGVTFGQ